MQQNEITRKIDLLDERGFLTEEGWAKQPLWRYERAKIAASPLRIKEWDYYYILSHDGQYGITFTMSDLGYISLYAICWLDLKKNKFYQSDSLGFFPMGRSGFPASSLEGELRHSDRKISVSCLSDGSTRIIAASSPRFIFEDEESELQANFTLTLEPNADSIAIATSWKENRRAFYYNHKVNCMRADGEVRIGKKKFRFTPDTSFAGLDWGRGRWTYRNRWYWGSASGLYKGELFGFNIGYGFSDRTPASENALFYKNKIHKLDKVEFVIDTSDYMKPWRFTANDGRFDVYFEPALDRNSRTDMVIIKSLQHQLFGYFSGIVVLDNGKKLKFGRLLGFAEDVLNLW